LRILAIVRYNVMNIRMARLTLIRHATLLVELAGQTLLVDPMLDDAAAQPPVEDSANDRRNPLVALPVPAEAILDRADAVVVTHPHIDHLDPSARTLLSDREIPVLCQPADHDRLRELRIGAPLIPVSAPLTWRGIDVARTDGRHGTGEMAELLGPVSGFVLSAGADRIYVAGDTVWCDEVRDAIDEHDPTVVVVNAGEARVGDADPITMSADDVIAVARHAAGRVVAVHMEALNHCGLSRAKLKAAAEQAGVDIHVPANGDTIEFDRSLDNLPAR
jgi:L-ascorbate metabolism protein UlaG (beta-lactamase superfamily)